MTVGTVASQQTPPHFFVKNLPENHFKTPGGKG
jgi:hypothetical protein